MSTTHPTVPLPTTDGAVEPPVGATTQPDTIPVTTTPVTNPPTAVSPPHPPSQPEKLLSIPIPKTTPHPPPIPKSPFSKSRPTPPPPLRLSSTLATINKSKFSFSTKPKTLSNNSRTAFLTAALSPSFVSSKPLHTRTHSTISEIVGNLAPERYLSLPPRSVPAAKALIATSVCKELRDVYKLETIRKRHGDVEGGGWFDYVLDSLGDATNLAPFVAKLQHLAIPPWHGISDRVQFLPLETLKIDSVMGHNFRDLVSKRGDHFRLSKVRPVESTEVRIGRMKNAIKAHIAKTQKQAESKIQPIQNVPIDQLEDDLRPPLPSSVPQQPVTNVATPPPAAPPVVTPRKEIVVIDDDPPTESIDKSSKPKMHLPVSLVFDDTSGKVSIDFEIREFPPSNSISPKTSTIAPPSVRNHTATAPPTAKKRTPAQRKAVPAVPTPPPQPLSRPNLRVQSGTNAETILPRPAPGPLPGNLEKLLNDIDDDVIPLGQQGKTPGNEPEVVLVDGAKETPAPKPTQRRTKRKRVDKSQERAVETEQRASRMRSAVVSALQEDPEARRQRSARASTANGHAKGKKKVSFTARRMTRRSRRNAAPILDSSGSEKEYRRDQDDDFTIDAEDVIEVLPVPKPNGTRAPPPNLSPAISRPPPPSLGRDAHGALTEIESLDGSDMVSPPTRVEPRGKHTAKRVSSRAASSSKHTRAPTSRRERPRQVDDTHEGEPELWNREVMKVEKLLEENPQVSEPLLNQIDFNPYRFYEQVPILRRVIKAAKTQHGHLMDMDKVDEYEEMAQFYNVTRNDPPYGSGTGCPGTEFLEEIFQQTERERMEAMHGYADDPVNDTLDILDEDRLEIPITNARTAGVVSLTGDTGLGSSPSRGSSESSGESSEEENGIYVGGSKRSRSHARSRASKARELQSRVCGDLLATMTNEAKRRVLRWAERDFSWFDRGVDVMEIVASRAYKRCNRCDAGGGEEENCEESILLKLWKDMSWRKVRRMRHRSSGTN